MTDERVSGRRIAELLASELTARTDGPLSALELVEVDPDADGSEAGTFAYAIALEATRLAEVFVHNDRIRLEFRVGIDAVSAAGAKANLRVRPAAEPPRTLVFVEDGETKRVLNVISAAIQTQTQT